MNSDIAVAKRQTLAESLGGALARLRTRNDAAGNVASSFRRRKLLENLTGQALGATVRVFDPQAMEAARPVLPDAVYCANAYACAEGASALVIATEWDAFRALALDRIRRALAEPNVVDLRNIYAAAEMRRRGFHYSSVGRE